MTLYLKYRPQKIDELDLTEVREQLAKIVASGRIPHAFLFAGPRGAGKTSAARILAKVVNCEKLEVGSEKLDNEVGSGKKSHISHQSPASHIPRHTSNIEPCNKCDQCVAITKGSSLDIIEIDAASHGLVDDARALREAAKLATAGARKKVYIIDEAHMLSNAASNALLKTLEEPPEHAMFILATTAQEKLLDTIRSRCTTLTFRKAKPEEIVRSLERAVNGEKLKVEKGVLEEMAGNVDGSFREAHKILEQLSLDTKSTKKITLEAAKKLVRLSLVSPETLLALLATKNTKEALKEIDRVAQRGVNLKAYTTEVVSVLRQMLLAQMGVGEEETPLRQGFAGQGDIRTLIELFSEAARGLPTAVIPQLPLELVVVRWCENEGEQSQSARLELNSAPPDRRAGPVRSRSRASRRTAGLSTLDSTSQDLPQTLAPNARGQAPAPGGLEEKWREIMRRVKPRNHSIEALLRATRVADFDGRTLKIEVFYEFHKERLEKDAYRKIVEEVASEVLGKPVRVLCVLSTSKQRAADIANIIEEEVEEDILKAAEEIFGKNANEDAN